MTGADKLAAEFPVPTREQWQELVRAVLSKSENIDAKALAATEKPEELLTSTTYDGIQIAPLYTADDQLAELPRYRRSPNNWDVCVRHDNPDAAEVNAAALNDLRYGADMLWLCLGKASLPVEHLDVALTDIALDRVPLVLEGGAEQISASKALLAHYDQQGIAAEQARGCLGIDPIGFAARSGTQPNLDVIAASISIIKKYPALNVLVVDALPWHSAGGSAAEELAYSIATGVAYLRLLTDSGLAVDTAAATLEFRYAVNADQFLEIAKFRAARRLWTRIAEVCGISNTARVQRLHAVTSPVMMTRRDPWVNMLRTTSACFAAGIGGADAITVAPFDSALGLSSASAQRIARNTSSILLDESTIAAVGDPAGGSWYVESLTDSLTRKAWEIFTAIERSGGIAADLESGRLAERLARTRAEREHDIATRSTPITGVSEFPDLNEQPLPQTQATVTNFTGLPVMRNATPFEALRDRSDAWLDRTGQRPTVFLATVDAQAQHISFVANAFASGGFTTTNMAWRENNVEIAHGFHHSGSQLACICANDHVSTSALIELATALKQAGAAWIVGSGPAFPGVEHMVNSGGDLVKILTEAWKALDKISTMDNQN